MGLSASAFCTAVFKEAKDNEVEAIGIKLTSLDPLSCELVCMLVICDADVGPCPPACGSYAMLRLTCAAAHLPVQYTCTPYSVQPCRLSIRLE
eukprot:4911493-Pleurochrysis_carterae.AAC.1